MARNDDVAPPPPPDDAPAGPPDRIKVGLRLTYGLDNYGSVGFDVGLETSVKDEDGSTRAAFKRAVAEIDREFNERDAEIRRGLGKRMQGKPPPANIGATTNGS